jgi:hypothetical protein
VARGPKDAPCALQVALHAMHTAQLVQSILLKPRSRESHHSHCTNKTLVVGICKLVLVGQVPSVRVCYARPAVSVLRERRLLCCCTTSASCPSQLRVVHIYACHWHAAYECDIEKAFLLTRCRAQGFETSFGVRVTAS